MTARGKFLLWYGAAWLPLAALYSLLIYAQMADPSLAVAIEGGFETTAFAALLGLGVWRVIHRLSERPRSRWIWFGAHVGLAVGYSGIWNASTVASIRLFAPPEVLTAFVRYALGWSFMTGLILYGLIAGVACVAVAVARLRREREAAARAEALRARAELSALRAQMNPHFLFNTLHSLAALAKSDPRAVEDGLEQLAQLLRRMLDSNRVSADYVSLSEEWEIVNDQLALERLRFGDRLRVVAEIDHDALECRIPIFSLQAIVENAIRHAVSRQTTPCTVTIRSQVDGEALTLSVRDDGPGADAKAVMNANGLGVRAVRQRLLALYGDRAGVHLETSPGAGFFVELRLPAEIARTGNTGELVAATHALASV